MSDLRKVDGMDIVNASDSNVVVHWGGIVPSMDGTKEVSKEDSEKWFKVRKAIKEVAEKYLEETPE